MTDILSNDKRKGLTEKKYTMQISAFEMAFILELRKHTFGRITAVVTDGVPYRVEIGKSIMLLNDEESQQEITQQILVEEQHEHTANK